MKRVITLIVLSALVVTMALLPLAIIVKQAFTPESESFAWPPTWIPRQLTADNLRAVRTTVELGRGLWMSVLVALLTVCSSLALALPAAWVGARGLARERSRVETIVTITRIFPAIALAVPFAVLFVRAGLYNHPAGLGLWLAHTVLGIPFAFLILRTGFRSVPTELEEAARLEGASTLTTFFLITLPLVRPALAAAAILVFLVSWDEFAFALLLQVTNRPLPPLLYYLAAFGHPGLASAVAAIMLVPALAVIFILEPALRSGALSGSGR
jgi:ABC-type glycerol-3-phosphate transport system permease component